MSDKTKIQITVGEGFDKILADLEKVGYTRPEMVKAGLRLLHKKEFPVYAKKGKAPEGMTDEEICTDVMGGELLTENGMKYCLLKKGNLTTKVPLSAIKDQLT